MEPLSEHEELKRIAPTLHGLPKADPFVVPDGFFDRFPHQVQAAIVESARHERTPFVLWWKRIAVALPMAAILGVGTWMLTHQNGGSGTPITSVTPLTDDELDALDDAELFAALDEADAADNSTADLGEVELDLNEVELLAYLETENADLTDLIIELE